MDFRGRVYPCPPHLNHLGSDMARSLLCFAKGEPLGSNGFNWLKVNLKYYLFFILSNYQLYKEILFLDTLYKFNWIEKKKFYRRKASICRRNTSRYIRFGQ